MTSAAPTQNSKRLGGRKKRHRPPESGGAGAGRDPSYPTEGNAGNADRGEEAPRPLRPSLGEFLTAGAHRRPSDSARSDGEASVVDVYLNGAEIERHGDGGEHVDGCVGTVHHHHGSVSLSGRKRRWMASTSAVLLLGGASLRLTSDWALPSYGPSTAVSGGVRARAGGASGGSSGPSTTDADRQRQQPEQADDGATQADNASRSYQMRQVFSGALSDPATLKPGADFPQARALDWIATRDARRLEVDDPHLVQRYVLAVLYYSTSGVDSIPSVRGNRDRIATGGEAKRKKGGWRKSHHWLSSLHECDWNDGGGVRSCDEDGYVTDLSLWNNLVGTIPSEIGHLSKLQMLYLSRNRLSGTIPTTLGLLTDLTYLGLQHNKLTGTVPAHSLGTLKKLRTLNLEKNDLTGIVRFVEPLCQLMVDATPPRGQAYVGGSLKQMTADCRQLVPWKEPEIVCSCCTTCYRA